MSCFQTRYPTKSPISEMVVSTIAALAMMTMNAMRSDTHSFQRRGFFVPHNIWDTNAASAQKIPSTSQDI